MKCDIDHPVVGALAVIEPAMSATGRNPDRMFFRQAWGKSLYESMKRTKKQIRALIFCIYDAVDDLPIQQNGILLQHHKTTGSAADQQSISTRGRGLAMETAFSSIKCPRLPKGISFRFVSFRLGHSASMLMLFSPLPPQSRSIKNSSELIYIIIRRQSFHT